MDHTLAGGTGLDRRAQIEALIAAYPNTTDDELQDLRRWFTHEATALDVGMIASNPTLSAPYRRFRADHLDRMTVKDYAVMACVTAMVAALLAYAVWYFA